MRHADPFSQTQTHLFPNFLYTILLKRFRRRDNKLHVFSLTPDQTTATFESTGGYSQVNITNGTTIGKIGVLSGKMYMSTLNSGDVEIRTANALGMTVKDLTGNIGIGTITPSQKLDVNGSSINKNASCVINTSN
jgi:hypothetical protein